MIYLYITDNRAVKHSLKSPLTALNTNKLKMKRQLTTKAIKRYLLNNNIKINEQIRFKLNMLDDLINDYYICNQNIKENGFITTFNNEKTKGINPIIKYKVQLIKLILRTLQEVGIKTKIIDEDYEDVNDFLERLTS